MNREEYFDWIRGKRVTFCGVGRTHMPLVQLYLEKGAVVSVRDKRTLGELKENGEILRKLGVKLVLGEDYLKDLTEEVIFRTPAIRPDLPEFIQAQERGAILTSEMETFFELCPCKIYGITGSDGKTTTTTILSEFLKAQGKTVHLGGNIGKPLLPEIEAVRDTDVVVAELSSFQLMSMRNSPHVSVVTNLSPNHLNWHKNEGEYYEAKKNIFLYQGENSRTVLNADNEITASFAPEVKGDLWLFSRKGKVANGVWYDGGQIFVNGEKLMDAGEIKIPGMHNVENYMAAIAAAWGDVSLENMRKVAGEFSGVEHRIELARELDGVKYFNDSIATSPSRTMQGLLSVYGEGVVLICGGSDKGFSFDSLGVEICEKVKTVILMGNTGPKIEEAVRRAPDYQEGRPVIRRAKDMEEAVRLARDAARPGDVVALSPASASFDLYKDFEERGRHFKELVSKL